MIAYVLLRIAARLHRLTMPALRLAELVCQRLFLRRPVAEIDKPPPCNPSKPQLKHSPTNWNFDMLDFPRTALRLRGDDSWRVCATSLALALLTCLIATDGFTAPLPSQLGPEVAITRPRDGYVGRLNVAPENGPAGTEVTVTADQLPPNQELALVWRTVKGNWKVDGPEYHGRDFKPVGYEIAKVKSDNDGRLTARFVVPEDLASRTTSYWSRATGCSRR